LVDFTEIAVLIIIVAIGALYAWYASTVIRKKPVTGAESLVGARGVVCSETLCPEGEVSMDGVIWRASLANSGGPCMKKGQNIIVDRVEGLTLMVKPCNLLLETSSAQQ
jgi:membrane protein implicated in regulation of membrane protease activity